MDTLSTQWIKMLIGVVAIFCLLSGRTELGVLFLLMGISVPLARKFVQLTELPFERPYPERR